jgi:hypothetical protein
MLDKSNLICFIRKMAKHEYLFENGNLILKKIIRKKSVLSTIYKASNRY